MKLKARAWLRRFVILLVLLFGTIDIYSLVIGFCLITTGIFLHIWSIGCLVRNKELTTWGPYRFVRHPFYLANFLIDMGLCSASVNPFIFIIYLILFYFIYYLRMKKEEAYLISLFPAEYPQYRKLVPRFIPLLFNMYPKTNKGFSCRVLVASGNEITRVLRLLIYPLILYFQFRRFSAGVVSLYSGKTDYIRLPSDIISGIIDYQEIIIIVVILVLSIISVFVKHKADNI
jgi:protein-S-isoprenylcysteine O-methyltransferase Ste14